MSGARVDLGELDAALAVLDNVPPVGRGGELGARVLQARASVLELAGRTEEAAEILAGIDARLLAAALGEEDEDVVVYDLSEELEEEDEDSDVTGDEPDASTGEPEAAPDEAETGSASSDPDERPTDGGDR